MLGVLLLFKISRNLLELNTKKERPRAVYDIHPDFRGI